jgi:hypothetical protein
MWARAARKRGSRARRSWSCGCRIQARDGEHGAAGEGMVEARERRESEEEAREGDGEEAATSLQLQRVSLSREMRGVRVPARSCEAEPSRTVSVSTGWMWPLGALEHRRYSPAGLDGDTSGSGATMMRSNSPADLRICGSVSWPSCDLMRSNSPASLMVCTLEVWSSGDLSHEAGCRSLSM